MDMITRIWLKYKANHPVIAATKKNRTYAVRVLGSHSSVPGLSDLIVMGRQTFGGFWNVPRPWDNPHCKMTEELRLALPKRVLYHEELGWLNHQSYYEAAIDMYVEHAFITGGRNRNGSSACEPDRILNNFKHVVYRILKIVVNIDYATLTERQREIRYQYKRDALLADRQAVAAGNATDQQMKRRAVKLQCHQKYYDLAVLLRVMQSLDPDEFAQVPECLLTGRKNYRLNDDRNKWKKTKPKTTFLSGWNACPVKA